MQPITDNLVPDNPKPGQVYTAPEGQTVGTVQVINVIRSDKILGDASQILPITNVAGKNLLSRVTTRTPLRKGMRIRVRALQYYFRSAIFVQYFGWMGHEIDDNVTVILDDTYRIDYLLQVGPRSDKFFTYERVCLTHVEEKK